MKNVKWIPMLLAALFALPVFAQPLVMDDVASADLKAQIYENQVAETSGASTSAQTDNGAPAAEEAYAASSVQEPAAEPKVASSEHASVSTEHPQKPVAKAELKRVHVVKHAKKKTG